MHTLAPFSPVSSGPTPAIICLLSCEIMPYIYFGLVYLPIRATQRSQLFQGSSLPCIDRHLLVTLSLLESHIKATLKASLRATIRSLLVAIFCNHYSTTVLHINPIGVLHIYLQCVQEQQVPEEGVFI